MTLPELRKEIEATELKLRHMKAQVESGERACRHQWGETKYDPIHHKGYEIPGDTPGTMGVDWRGPMWVEPTTEKRWTRTCTVCDKTEITQRTKQQNCAGAIAGTSAKMEVPDFGDRTSW